MKICPYCGQEISGPGTGCPSCHKEIRPPFTILDFLWGKFRLFALIGITGTMISIIPNMGSRILGESWIASANSSIQFLLSLIIFFGTVFLTICFLMIFTLVLRGRSGEPVTRHVSVFTVPLCTWYEGDLQRIILLFCLVPMWISLTLFFLLLMPVLPHPVFTAISKVILVQPAM